MAKRYALKGVNDDETICSVCGKVELRRVMWLVELDGEGNETGEPFAVGTSCGAKLLGYNVAKVRKAADTFKTNVQIKRERLAAWRAWENGENEIMKEINKLDMSFLERKQTPLWAKREAIIAEAKAWASAQSVVIEL